MSWNFNPKYTNIGILQTHFALVKIRLPNVDTAFAFVWLEYAAPTPELLAHLRNIHK